MMRSVVSAKFLGAICVVCLLLQQEDLPVSNYYKASAVEQVGCIQKEMQALLELKAGLVLDDLTLLPSWKSAYSNSSSDCCEWKGIICSKKTGHVQMLDLNGHHYGPFRGEISSSLIKLKHLKHLNLSWNRFIGNPHIPSFFGSLRSLRLLDLKGSHIGGRIPYDLANLSHLQYLDLSLNNLEGTIPQQLGNLSHLQYLDLGENYLVGTIPHPLGSLSNLQELYLGYNKGLKIHELWLSLSNLTLLTHLDLTQVHNLNLSNAWLQMIGMLPKIQELVLCDCDLSDLFLLSLSPSVLNFSTSLTKLDLSRNAFTSSLIFQWVFNASSNITHLDLRLNLLEGPILYDFGNIRNPLQHLDLSYNALQGGILESISDICTLHTLYIDSINLNEDISTILLSFSGCARYSLQNLSLFYNQITGTLSELPMFPSLKNLDLSNNQLNGKLPEADKLPSKLESLIVKSNSLQGGIPKSFGNICSLVVLDMSNNKLSEELSGIIHNLSSGCAKHSLLELRLDGNQITGTLPDMSMFTSLEILVLSDNLLNGTIHEKIRFPPQLKNLNMNSNNLEGVISDSHFANMHMLKSVKLSYNPLVLTFSENWVPPFQLVSIFLSSCMLGPKFPTWLQNQNYMYELDISNAGISDAVPMWFWYQTTNLKLKYMNISHNNLTGTIPNLPIRFYVGCHVLFASNQLTGSIPSFLRSAASLDFSSNKFSEAHELLCANTTIDELGILDLSNNQLPGLPDCWSHFKALVFLDLSDNPLSGKVPPSIGSLLELQVLILRNNNLTGKLPLSLRNCTKLFMLDLGENRLSGAIPSWLGQQLQMLSLRRNQFSGSLPHNLCYLTSIQLLDLSANNLWGPIFNCLKNFTAMSQKDFSTSNMGEHTYHSKLSSFFSTYDLDASLMWKGAEQVFKNNKHILRSIDLSSNQLSGGIPEEIGDLVGLVSLNISNNNLSGEITSKIGSLKSLEFLDLSRNHFFGSIPPTLAQIDRLSMLDLSCNNLCGRIPLGTQLQSFDASSYEGNADLCGKPLDKKCPGDEEAPQEAKSSEESNPEDKNLIYLSVALGFITGFWGLFGSLLLSCNWRHAYMLFLNNIVDTVYVFTAVKAAKFQRWLKGLMEKYV